MPVKDRLFLSASSFYGLYRPSLCERRVYLSAHEVPVPVEASELDLLIKELGERHEREHLAGFPEYRDLGEGNHGDRFQRTKEAMASGTPVIYQGVLRAAFPGSKDLVTGIPDLMIRDRDSYRIRDCKLSRSMDEGSHPEILRQLQTYGWLFEEVTGKPPAALEAYLGTRQVQETLYEGADAALGKLGRLREISRLEEEPYTPVGWSKCSPCLYYDRCWSAAEAAHDVSLVYRLDQATAHALRRKGVRSYDDLLREFTAASLAALPRTQGSQVRRVGSAAGRILENARALATGAEIRVGKLELPVGELMVMFDLEGVPPQYEELEKVYLWGMQLFRLASGEPGAAGPYSPAVADFGPGGEEAGWHSFLSLCGQIFAQYGDVPFVHWASYEKSKLTLYAARYGDPDGTAERVKANCFDLLPAILKAFALPLPSYSLKVVEGLAGFRRTMEEYGGDWSIARYIRASESKDEVFRKEVMDTILRYNEEDLQATWAVLLWARALSIPPRIG